MHPINLNPTQTDLRIFALLLVPFSAMVWWLWGGASSPVPVRWLTVILAGMGVVGALFPVAVKWFYIAWMIAVYPIGWAVSLLIMALIYFALITPVGFVRRTFFGDPLQRKVDPSNSSYWVALTPPTSKEAYFRQS